MPNITLTSNERENLRSYINLSDGHARRSPVPGERTVLDDLKSIYTLSQQYDALTLERQFVTAHLELVGQNTVQESFTCYSASEALLIAAQALMSSGARKAAILEPTFDGIPSLFAVAGLATQAISEKSIIDFPLLENVLKEVDILAFASPNNPTGKLFNEREFQEICKRCAAQHVSVLVDASFRAFDKRAWFNYYSFLEDTQVDWMVVEDTGKLWATNGIKAGILTASQRYTDEVRRHFECLVLSISPFTLTLLWQLAEKAANGATGHIQKLIANNRELLWQMLMPLGCVRLYPESQLSVEVVGLSVTQASREDTLIKKLLRAGVGVVGGSSFYWNDGKHMPAIRIALSRDPDVIRQGGLLIAEALEGI